MAYEKQTWANGDVITAEKLNHMEDGIAQGGAFVVHIDLTNQALIGTTYDEINEAFKAGKAIRAIGHKKTVDIAGMPHEEYQGWFAGRFNDDGSIVDLDFEFIYSINSSGCSGASAVVGSPGVRVTEFFKDWAQSD